VSDTLLDDDAASGEEIVRRLLCAKVDLLYNGGIGTYVRASDEPSSSIPDHANDRVRVLAILLQFGAMFYWMWRVRNRRPAAATV
jgi:NAD-specific glutamate dehydrogenase